MYDSFNMYEVLCYQLGQEKVVMASYHPFKSLDSSCESNSKETIFRINNLQGTESIPRRN